MRTDRTPRPAVKRRAGRGAARWRLWCAWLPLFVKPLRRGVVIFVLLLVIEYLVVPELVGASKDLHLLGRVNAAWLAAGAVLEGVSLFCYGLLTQAVLPLGAHNPGLSRLFRIDLAAAAVAHVIPAGTVGSAGIGYRLFTAEGIKGNDAAVMMATKGLGSTVVLNVLLWLSLVVSIPLAGFHPIYVTVAYGIANVAGVLPVTPAGLGVIDSVAPLMLVSFGVTRSVATLGVLGWRLVNFWLPIPVGAAAYVSLKVPRGAGLKAMRTAVATLLSRPSPPDEKPDNPQPGAPPEANS